jgi:NAD+ diphosphatase
MMSTLAGFVEPGETPEEAVAREVLEETGVAVARVRYHSSQPWPFPGSLMIGFVAEVEGRPQPRVDDQELEAAAWFDRAQLRNFAALGFTLPRPHSIARRLIEDWLAA